MYSNFSRSFVIETIDFFLSSRVLALTPNTIEHQQARRVRDTIMPLMIFLLEHIFIYIEWGEGREFYAQRQGLPTGGSFSDAIAILCMWLCEKNLLLKWQAHALGIQMYARFVDDISIKLWVPKDGVDDAVSAIKLELNSWDKCIKIDPILYTVTNPLVFSGESADFLDLTETHVPFRGSIRIETSIFRKMGPVFMHAPWSSALPSAVKLGTVISQRIRYIVTSSTQEAFDRSWAPYHRYFMNIGYSAGMMGKVIEKFPYSKRAALLAAMARRGFTSWDKENGEHAAGRVVPLVLGAHPSTRDFWDGFKSLRLDTFDGFPRAALDHLPVKILNSLTCTASLGDLFKTKGGLFAPSRP